MHHADLELQSMAFAVYPQGPAHASRADAPPADARVAPPARPARPAGLVAHGAKVDTAGLSRHYGARQVLKDVDLRIEPGEFIAIVGRSGCGKSTLLRLLAGLEAPDSGAITLDGQAHARHQADIRIMFQDARLLPWKSVLDNVRLGLKGADARDKSLEALAQVGLADRANDWPAVLSGGQRQRVALARALVHTPRLLLLDEPLGALDALTRIEMHRLIERLWRQHDFTALLVTHDVTEAVALADRVLLIENQGIALDERIVLPRPRERGAAFAEIEGVVLRRVLREDEPAAPPVPAAPLEPASPGQWLWAM